MRTIGERCLGALAALSLAAGLAACGSSSSGSAVPQRTASASQRATHAFQTCNIDTCVNDPGNPVDPTGPPPACDPSMDPQCTGLYEIGTPCDPYIASCGPGGNPFARPDPGQFMANQIAFHQPQCSDVYGAGVYRKNFHNCYVFGSWYP
ncbi:MAG TPA: hypothetical protein VGD01_13750 [Candidatus Elarobacter sp.]|jgi:hypothetical protein